MSLRQMSNSVSHVCDTVIKKTNSTEPPALFTEWPVVLYIADISQICKIWQICDTVLPYFVRRNTDLFYSVHLSTGLLLSKYKFKERDFFLYHISVYHLLYRPVIGIYDDIHPRGGSEGYCTWSLQVPQWQVELFWYRHCHPQPYWTRPGWRQRIIYSTLV